MLVGFISLTILSCQNKNSSSDTSDRPLTIADSIAGTYKLKPDKRFLLAVGNIHHFMTGEDETLAKSDFSEGEWHISYQGTEVGTLPEIPDFQDLESLLEHWAATLQKDHALELSDSNYSTSEVIEKELNSFQPISVAHAMNEVGELWKKSPRSSLLMSQATKGLVRLNVMHLDKFGLADEVPAKALAVLALTKALTKQHMEREECLLSYTMGYSEHGLRVSSSLSSLDPVRLYIEQKDQQLMNVASSDSGTVEGKYLSLLRLASNGELEPFWNWAGKYFNEEQYSLLIFKCGLEMHTFSISPDMAEALPRVVLVSVALDATTMPDIANVSSKGNSQPLTPAKYKFLAQFVDQVLRSETSTLLNSFESGIAALDKRYQGPFLDGKTYEAFYKGYFFSSFYTIGIHYLDQISSIEGAKMYDTLLGESKEGIASEIQRWYGDLTKSKEGKLPAIILLDDMKLLNHLGAPAIARIMDEFEDYCSPGDVSILSAMKEFAGKLDSRPSEIIEFSDRAYHNLADLKLAENLTVHLIKSSASLFPFTQVWLAHFQGNDIMMKQLIDSGSFDLISKIQILRWFDADGRIGKEEISGRYRNLISRNPSDYELSYWFAKYLEKSGMYDSARFFMRAWLDRKVPTDGLERVFCQTLIAQSYYDEKRYDDAWREIQPAAESWQRNAMGYASKILNKMGRTRESEKMARAEMDRYSDELIARMDIVSLLWEWGRYTDAAQVLKNSPHAIRGADLQSIVSPRFFETMSQKDKDEVIKAFSALIGQGFDNIGLMTLSYPFESSGKHEIAFEMTSRLHANGGAQYIFWAHAYRNLKVYRGDTVALAWLQNLIPAGDRNFAGMAFYDQGRFELLWDVVKDPESGGHGPDFVWLMRAAAVVRSGMEKNPHWNEVVEHYKETNKSYYDVTGRFLVGLAKQDEVLALATDPKKVCELSYYIGLKAQAYGRYEEASDWFRSCIETGLTNNGEYRWSFMTLMRWLRSGKNLSRLAAEEKQKMLESFEENL